MRPLATECAILTLEPIKIHYVHYIQCGCWSQSSTIRGLPCRCLGVSLVSFELCRRVLQQHCHFWEGVLVLEGNLTCFTASSSEDVDVLNHLFKAKNLVFLGFSLSLSSELSLVVPLAISYLALGLLGNALLLGGGGSGVEVFQIWLIHLSLLAATSCCCWKKVLVTGLPCCFLTA